MKGIWWTHDFMSFQICAIDHEDSLLWERVEIVKNNNDIDGFILLDHYQLFI